MACACSVSKALWRSAAGTNDYLVFRFIPPRDPASLLPLTACLPALSTALLFRPRARLHAQMAPLTTPDCVSTMPPASLPPTSSCEVLVMTGGVAAGARGWQVGWDDTWASGPGYKAPGTGGRGARCSS